MHGCIPSPDGISQDESNGRRTTRGCYCEIRHGGNISESGKGGITRCQRTIKTDRAVVITVRLQSVRWNRDGSGRSRQCPRRAKVCRGEDAAYAHINVIRCSTAGKSIPGKRKRLRRINRLGSGEVADMRRVGLSPD